MLLIRPDLVVASAFDKRSTRELLKAKGLRLAELAVPRTLERRREQIREAGDIIGHPDRAAGGNRAARCGAGPRPPRGRR